MNAKLSSACAIAAALFSLFDCTTLAALILVPTLDDNTPGTTRQLRGGTIDYSVVITNTGDANATSVSLTNPTPLNTTDIAVTKPNIQPV